MSHTRARQIAEKIREGEQLTPVEAVEGSNLLTPVLSSEGWLIFSALVLRLRAEALEAGVLGTGGEQRSRDYYQGFVEATDQIAAMLKLHVEAGQIKQQKKGPPSREVVAAFTSDKNVGI